MCGLIGEFAWAGALTPRAAFVGLRDLAASRGPDSTGYWTDDRQLQLGFRRLAILDTSERGNQPMLTPSGRWVMIYNGEMYNYREIQGALPADRYPLRSRSDSEVVLYAFEHFGVAEATRMLDGMFAIALYDRAERRLHLVRDFAGIKPLHYAILGGGRRGAAGWSPPGAGGRGVLFASQYDQLARHPGLASRAVSPPVLKLYLRQHFVPAPFGMLEDTFQVEPGEVVTFGADGLQARHRYWTLPEPAAPAYGREGEALDRLDAALGEAVRAELIADVPLGTFLSGGVDSPLVTWYAQQASARPVSAFTIGTDSPGHDESERARAFAREIGAEFNLTRMDAGCAREALDGAMRTLREPFADLSIVPTYLVARHARTRVTVALSGDGGDELFFGYDRFWTILRNLPFRRLPRALRRPVHTADRLLTSNRLVDAGLLAPTLGARHFRVHSRFSEALLRRVVPDLAGVLLPDAFDVYAYPDDPSVGTMLARMRRAEFYGMMQKTLTKVDRAGMGVSLEVRVPFLKRSLIELALCVDPRLSYGRTRRKHLLRALLRRAMPAAPGETSKVGFGIPLGRWLREDRGLRSEFEGRLRDPAFQAGFGVTGAAVEDLFAEHGRGRDRTWPLFTLYALARWDAERRA